MVFLPMVVTVCRLEEASFYEYDQFSTLSVECHGRVACLQASKV
jgi:hypothetical protein